MFNVQTYNVSQICPLNVLRLNYFAIPNLEPRFRPGPLLRDDVHHFAKISEYKDCAGPSKGVFEFLKHLCKNEVKHDEIISIQQKPLPYTIPLCPLHTHRQSGQVLTCLIFNEVYMEV